MDSNTCNTCQYFNRKTHLDTFKGIKFLCKVRNRHPFKFPTDRCSLWMEVLELKPKPERRRIWLP
jgi:hypothetical protein